MAAGEREADANIFTLQPGPTRAHTRARQRREALKGIRVEVCWRGRLFGTGDMSQWGLALGNPITATGGTEQRGGRGIGGVGGRGDRGDF